MPKKSAVEMIVYNPYLGPLPHGYGGHENLWIKEERFNQNYVSIGFFVKDSSTIQYFLFNDRNKPVNEIKFYSSLAELTQDFPSIEAIFQNAPHLFIMGHNGDGKYRLGGAHLGVVYDESEQIYGRNIDKVINCFEQALPQPHDQITVTIEACNAADLTAAKQREEYELSLGGVEESKRRELEAQKKSFIERLSDNHPQMVFCGTAPWSSEERETGSRASGGYPQLNIPITSMGGNIWKSGYNTVVFYNRSLQVVVRKSAFASTESAKKLKLNTIAYADEILKRNIPDLDERERILQEICTDPTILKIGDLENNPCFPKKKSEDDSIIRLEKTETEIIAEEKANYIQKVKRILAKSTEEFSPRDLLIIALGLNHSEVFNGRELLKENILSNQKLLNLLMVTSGKVLIGGPDNNHLIELLISRGANVDSIDEKGMTALHYAASNFYNYREEPLDLIEKLLKEGANPDAPNIQDETPRTLAAKRDNKVDDQSREKLLAALECPQADECTPRFRMTP